jgi:anti-sigma regulatory factor (Ser/Thr protein kinase)
LPRTPQSLTLVAKPESLGRVTQFVRKGAQQANLPESRMGELDLLIEEVFMNISRHSYPQGASGIVTVTCFIPAPGELAIEVGDQGIEFNPLTTSPPDLTLDLARRPIGGLGVFLLKSFANSLSYRREEGWNRLTFGISSNR